MIDLLLYGIFPYVAVTLAVSAAILRFTTNRFSYSSLSSQFLEGRKLFWGSVSWHYGIALVLIGHIIGILLPSGVKAFNGAPLRLYLLECTGLALGLLALFGLALLMIRRGATPRIRVVTSRMDVIVLILLLVQVAAGVGTALFYRWGSLWFVQTAPPYLWSLVTLTPDVSYVSAMPFLVKLHVFNAFVLTALFPFSRLVHFISLPIPYLWRPYQLVMWNRN